MDEEMKNLADEVKMEMIRNGDLVLLRKEDAVMVRKILQCANTLYTVMEDGYAENKVDRLIRYLRGVE